MGAGAQGIGPSPTAVPGALAGSWMGSAAATTQTGAHQGMPALQEAAYSSVPKCWPSIIAF